MPGTSKKTPLVDDMRRLCHLIEALDGCKLQTEISIKANDIYNRICGKQQRVKHD